MERIISFSKKESILSIQCVFDELCEICAANGFARKGKAFFRVIGDGVLQVLKFEKELHGDYYSLSFGMFSMYGELKKQWFSAKGCIPRYYIVNLVGLSTPSTFVPTEKEFYAKVDSPREQLDILRTKGLPWLNGITTQKHLVEGLCYLDTIRHSAVRWNDCEKFAPFLYSGDLENAQKVVDSILEQHHFAQERNRQTMDASAYARYCALIKEEDEHLIEKKMLLMADTTAIQKYLAANYSQNIIYSQFCTTFKPDS